jgi:hypothetical protein
VRSISPSNNVVIRNPEITKKCERRIGRNVREKAAYADTLRKLLKWPTTTMRIDIARSPSSEGILLGFMAVHLLSHRRAFFEKPHTGITASMTRHGAKQTAKSPAHHPRSSAC